MTRSMHASGAACTSAPPTSWATTAHSALRRWCSVRSSARPPDPRIPAWSCPRSATGVDRTTETHMQRPEKPLGADEPMSGHRRPSSNRRGTHSARIADVCSTAKPAVPQSQPTSAHAAIRVSTKTARLWPRSVPCRNDQSHNERPSTFSGRSCLTRVLAALDLRRSRRHVYRYSPIRPWRLRSAARDSRARDRCSADGTALTPARSAIRADLSTAARRRSAALGP